MNAKRKHYRILVVDCNVLTCCMWGTTGLDISVVDDYYYYLNVLSRTSRPNDCLSRLETFLNLVYEDEDPKAEGFVLVKQEKKEGTLSSTQWDDAKKKQEPVVFSSTPRSVQLTTIALVLYLLFFLRRSTAGFCEHRATS